MFNSIRYYFQVYQTEQVVPNAQPLVADVQQNNQEPPMAAMAQLPAMGHGQAQGQSTQAFNRRGPARGRGGYRINNLSQ